MTSADVETIVQRAREIEYYNTERLHSSIGYITPADKLRGRENEVWGARDRKLEAARARRGQRREQMAATV